MRSCLADFSSVPAAPDCFDDGGVRMAELDRLIAAGWGEVPGRKIPTDWQRHDPAKVHPMSAISEAAREVQRAIKKPVRKCLERCPHCNTRARFFGRYGAKQRYQCPRCLKTFYGVEDRT